MATHKRLMFVFCVCSYIFTLIVRDLEISLPTAVSILVGCWPSFVYILLASILIEALPGQGQNHLKNLFSFTAGALIYEFFQYWLSTMYFDWVDVVATLLGLSVAITLCSNPHSTEAD